MKNTKKHESGRSMIEMVGVLAIAGLLTAGAFVLIQNGMSSQKRARAADEVSALLASARSLSAERDDFNNLGSTLSADITTYTGYVNKIMAATPSATTFVGNPATTAQQMLKMSTNVTPFGGTSYYAILGVNQYLMIGIMCLDQDDCQMMTKRSFSGAVGSACSVNNASNNGCSGKYTFNVLFTK